MSDDCLFAGIDVSKKMLNLSVRLDKKKYRAASFPNSERGIKRLIDRLLSIAPSSRTALEPTGRHHIAVLHALAETEGCEAMPVNPRQARKFQEGRGGRGKNDGLDARSLADMASQLDHDGKFLVFVPPAENVRQLQLLGRQVAVHVGIRSKATCRIKSFPPDDPINALSIASNEDIVEFHQMKVDQLLDEMLQIVMEDERLTEIYGLLTQIRGIGKQSALQLMGELLVLPKGMGARQWTAVAGLDPRTNQSGMSNLPARISRMGNRYLRQILYMMAMNTTQFDPQIKMYYEQFHTKKGSKQLTLVVVMRRLLCGIWHMLNQMEPFDSTKCFAVRSK